MVINYCSRPSRSRLRTEVQTRHNDGELVIPKRAATWTPGTKIATLGVVFKVCYFSRSSTQPAQLKGLRCLVIASRSSMGQCERVNPVVVVASRQAANVAVGRVLIDGVGASLQQIVITSTMVRFPRRRWTDDYTDLASVWFLMLC